MELGILGVSIKYYQTGYVKSGLEIRSYLNDIKRQSMQRVGWYESPYSCSCNSFDDFKYFFLLFLKRKYLKYFNTANKFHYIRFIYKNKYSFAINLNLSGFFNSFVLRIYKISQ